MSSTWIELQAAFAPVTAEEQLLEARSTIRYLRDKTDDYWHALNRIHALADETLRLSEDSGELRHDVMTIKKIAGHVL